MMSLRIAFPAVMFVLAGMSFVYGTWQHFVAQSAREADASRLAFILETIEDSGLTRTGKQGLYASIAAGLPQAPPVFGIDVSGSFASQGAPDGCTNEGQRTLCRALQERGTDSETRAAVCGECDPL